MTDVGTSRRFTLLDAAVLIAATAIGLATVRAAGWMPGGTSLRGWSWYAAQALAAFQVAGYFLVARGPALVFLAMRLPRGRPWRAWRRPGTVACGALTATLIFQAIPSLIVIGTIGAPNALARAFLRGMEWQIEDYNGRAACAVAGAWAALLLAGQWRPDRGWLDRGWLDRAGRLLGLAWVAS